MAWMRKARMRTLNIFREELKRRGHMTEYEATVFLMAENFVSLVTAKRYLEELIMMGIIERNNDTIKLAKNEGEKKDERKTK
jgi:hypothetical protein